MKKINIATASVLIATAVLLVILFVLTLNIFNFLKSDTEQDTDEQVGTIIGLALLLILGIPIAFTWLIAAVIFLVFGVLRFVKKGATPKSNRILIVLDCIFGIIFLLSLWWFMPVYTTISTPVLLTGVVTALGFIAILVLSIIYRNIARRQPVETAGEFEAALPESVEVAETATVDGDTATEEAETTEE